MSDTPPQAILKQFQTIPGIGKSIALDLWDQGYRSLEELKGQDPEEMYLRQCALQGGPVDRCLLYVFRCAVYYVSNEQHEPELLKWWNWK
jgi:hypothetical protein